MFDIITFGSNCVDLFAHTDKTNLINISTPGSSTEFISYPVGGKILITESHHNLGGNGANTAVAFSRLGLKTGYIGKIGSDENGSFILKSLKKEKISFLGKSQGESGFSVVLDAKGDDRTLLVYKGCNNNLAYKDIKKTSFKTKWIYISSVLGKSLLTMEKYCKEMKKKGSKIGFNPSATLLEKETKSAFNLLKYTDVLVLNKEEAESLVGKNKIEENIKKLQVFGPEVIVITDGKKGATGFYKDKYYYTKPPRNQKIVETTGAGDAFASTLIAGLIMNKKFETCLKMASLNAESVIGNHGAQNILLSKKEIDKQLKKDKRKISTRKA
jgi:ribokinase